MQTATLIIYISFVVWIFPIFRQHNTQLFYFFLILGISDPINFLLVSVYSLKSGVVHSIAALLLFYSINQADKKLKLTYSDILVIALFLLALFFYDLILLLMIIHILILIRFLQTVIIDLHKNAKLSIPYLILVFYELTVIIKLFFFLSGTHTGIFFFYTTLAFQLLIGIFFTIFKIDDLRLTKHLNSNPSF